MAPLIVMVIEGHDWRYTGDGHYWRSKDDPEYTGTWADLLRRDYTEKSCMTCGWRGDPKAIVRPCNEIWSERTGFVSAIDVDAALYPQSAKRLPPPSEEVDATKPNL